MKFHRLLLALVVFCAACKREAVTTLESEIAQVAKAPIVYGRSPGVAVGIVNGGRTQTFFYGVKNLATAEPITENTTFQIASITKTFTALLVARLVANGQLALSDTANAYLPADMQIPNWDSSEVRIVQLLDHSSGLRREPPTAEKQPFGSFTLAQMATYLDTTTLLSRPGSTYSYSNTGFGLLGDIAGRVAGKSYAQLVNDEIFQPLGMTRSVCELSPVSMEDIAQGYYGNQTADYENYSEAMGGCYTIKSTIHDLMLYLQAMTDGAPLQLKPAMDLCIQPYFVIGTDVSEKVSEFAVGLGWHIFLLRDGNQWIWHNGALKGFGSFLGYNPVSGDGVVVLMNSTALEAQDVIGFKVLDILARY